MDDISVPLNGDLKISHSFTSQTNNVQEISNALKSSPLLPDIVGNDDTIHDKVGILTKCELPVRGEMDTDDSVKSTAKSRQQSFHGNTPNSLPLTSFQLQDAFRSNTVLDYFKSPEDRRSSASPKDEHDIVHRMHKRCNTALLALLGSHGLCEKIFLTSSELNDMHIFLFSSLVSNIKQQRFQGNLSKNRLFYFPFICFFFGFVGLVLCFLGFLLWFLTRHYVQLEVPYSSSYTTTRLSLNAISGWDAKRPVYIFAELKNFQLVYKSMVSKSAKKQRKECQNEELVRCLRALRPSHSVPEIPDLDNDVNILYVVFQIIRDPNQRLYPHGIVEYLFFNDYFSVYRDGSDTSLPIDTTDISSPYQLLFRVFDYIQCGREPSVLYWFSPLSYRFQNWMGIAWTLRNRILLGKLKEGFLPGSYKIVWTQNVWPAEELNVRKSLVFVQFSYLGASQKVLAIFCVLAGVFFIISAFLLRIYGHGAH